MGTELYLDTARLGRMCPGARLAEQEFGWLVSRLGSSCTWNDSSLMASNPCPCGIVDKLQISDAGEVLVVFSEVLRISLANLTIAFRISLGNHRP